MKNVTIVGVGALGSHVAMLLRNEAKLKLIDFDRVEQKNTMSQLHTKAGVGKLKVQALGAMMQFNWGLKVEQISNRLEEVNIDHLLSGTQLVIDCVDNIETRLVLQKWAASFVNGPFAMLHGALAADGQFGRAIWTESFRPDAASGTDVATCENGEHLPTIAIVSAYIAKAAQIYLKTGNKVGFSITPVGTIPT